MKNPFQFNCRRAILRLWLLPVNLMPVKYPFFVHEIEEKKICLFKWFVSQWRDPHRNLVNLSELYRITDLMHKNSWKKLHTKIEPIELIKEYFILVVTDHRGIAFFYSKTFRMVWSGNGRSMHIYSNEWTYKCEFNWRSIRYDFRF